MWKRCPVCHEDKLWFRVKKRSYIDTRVHRDPITSNNEICHSCMKDIQFAVLQKPSLKHYWKYRNVVLLNIKNKIWK